MREELRHWLTMAKARGARLQELGVKRPVLPVFNFQGYSAKHPGVPQVVINHWEYTASFVEEVLEPVMLEFGAFFSFLEPLLWNKDRPLDEDLVCLCPPLSFSLLFPCTLSLSRYVCVCACISVCVHFLVLCQATTVCLVWPFACL